MNKDIINLKINKNNISHKKELHITDKKVNVTKKLIIRSFGVFLK